MRTVLTAFVFIVLGLTPIRAADIYLYGDSTQRGVSVFNNEPVQNPFAPGVLLQAFLNSEFGVGTHQVRNFAQGGLTLGNALEQPLYDGMTIVEHIAAHRPDLVIANFGINGAYEPELTPALHREQYAMLKAATEQAGGVFFYQTPNPMDNGHNGILDAMVAAVM
ncbi:MAG: SGNH/GDSL hydrolase family protein, partial [Pseudomonadota bacterium]